jgi:hypothetical protein
MVYVSYFSGSSPAQRGPWHPDFERMFGVRHHLRYGLVDPIKEASVTLELKRPLGSAQVGDALQFDIVGSYSARSKLPYELTDATEIASSESGIALIQRAVGSGRIVLLTCPLEYFSTRTPAVNPDAATRLYRWLGEASRALPEFDNGGDPSLIVDTLTRDDGAVFAVVVTERTEHSVAMIGGTSIELEPWGSAIVQVR